MSALIRRVPMPDELDRGYMGRLMSANGYQYEPALFSAIERHLGLDSKRRHELSKTERLAAVAGLSSEQFVMNHSTLPLLRSITWSVPEVAHGSTDNRQILYRRTMVATRPDAYFCTACAKADIDFHGLSYWRRSLQVPGMLWCEKHDLPLRYVEYEKAMSQSPHELFEKGEAVDEEFAREAIENTYVRRFLSVASGLMDRPKPLRTDEIRFVLRDQAVAMGLQSGAGLVKGPLLSDFISKSFPKRWLQIVFPDVAEKPHGQFMHRVDGIFTARCASSVWPYILATAVLFDSSDQALSALFSAGGLPGSQANPKKHKGVRITDITAASSTQFRATHQRLAGGLIGSGSKEMWRAAYLFYVEKQSLSKSALAVGTPLEPLEEFLREIYPTFTARLAAMASTNFEKLQRRRSTKALSPKQAVGVAFEPIRDQPQSRDMEFQN